MHNLENYVFVSVEGWEIDGTCRETKIDTKNTTLAGVAFASRQRASTLPPLDAPDAIRLLASLLRLSLQSNVTQCKHQYRTDSSKYIDREKLTCRCTHFIFSQT